MHTVKGGQWRIIWFATFFTDVALATADLFWDRRPSWFPLMFWLIIMWSLVLAVAAASGKISLEAES